MKLVTFTLSGDGEARLGALIGEAAREILGFAFDSRQRALMHFF